MLPIISIVLGVILYSGDGVGVVLSRVITTSVWFNFCGYFKIQVLFPCIEIIPLLSASMVKKKKVYIYSTNELQFVTPYLQKLSSKTSTNKYIYYIYIYIIYLYK